MSDTKPGNLPATHEPGLSADILEKVALGGDLSGLDARQRLQYYGALCRSLGLNPLTQPLQYLQLPGQGEEQGKLVLYARKDCTDQLRKINKVNITIVSREIVADSLFVVTAHATLPDGREDEAIGAVAIKKQGGEWMKNSYGKSYFKPDGTYLDLTPDARANAIMKAECVPLDSEILTRGGWRKYDQIEVGFEVLAYDCDSDTCHWTPLLAVTEYIGLGLPMICMHTEGRQFEVICTPDHSWAVAKQPYQPRSNGNRGMRGPYANRGPARMLVEAYNVKTSDRLILSAPETDTQDSVLTPDEAAVVGWAVTDGTIQKRGTHRRVGICQSKEENFDAIRRLIQSVVHGGVKELVSKARQRTFPSSGRTYDTKEQHWWYLPAQVSRDLLTKSGFEDNGRHCLPGLVTRLSSPARKAMLEAMMLVEGDKKGIFANTDRDIIDAFQILCALEGVATGKETNRPGIIVQRKKLTKHVAGCFLLRDNIGPLPAWCPTTKYGTFVMRQNGRVMITGNTKAKRRVTLSIVGLGLMDESEIGEVEGAVPITEPEMQKVEPDRTNMLSLEQFDPTLEGIAKANRMTKAAITKMVHGLPILAGRNLDALTDADRGELIVQLKAKLKAPESPKPAPADALRPAQQSFLKKLKVKYQSKNAIEWEELVASLNGTAHTQFGCEKWTDVPDEQLPELWYAATGENWTA